LPLSTSLLPSTWSPLVVLPLLDELLLEELLDAAALLDELLDAAALLDELLDAAALLDELLLDAAAVLPPPVDALLEVTACAEPPAPPVPPEEVELSAPLVLDVGPPEVLDALEVIDVLAVDTLPPFPAEDEEPDELSLPEDDTDFPPPHAGTTHTNAPTAKLRSRAR
jgi:hypothetical protein